MKYLLEWIKENWIIFCIIVIVLLFSGWEIGKNLVRSSKYEEDTPHTFVYRESQSDDQTHFLSDPPTEEDYFVDIKGAVHYPNVYQIIGNERVIDIIEIAGGFTEDAAINQINLAEKVYDEMVIYIPTEDELGADWDYSSHSSTESGKIRINSATQSEIESLPGIGSVKAAAIIQFREENGPFSSIDDLQQISGIGSKTVENMKEYVQIP